MIPTNNKNAHSTLEKEDNGARSLNKKDDFLNIFEFNNISKDDEEEYASGREPFEDYVNSSVRKGDSNGSGKGPLNVTSRMNSTPSSSDNFNDLNKLLTNTVGNSEYLDMPLPLILDNNNNALSFDSRVKNEDNDFDTNSLLSYTTNNSYMTNNTISNSISNAGRGRNKRLGSVKSYRSTAADSLDDEVIRERKKKIHNNVEKKRRELIKNKIQELNELLPLSVIKIVNAQEINENLILNGRPKSELVDPFSIGNKDVKVRKRDILCGSLLYMRFLNKIVDKVSTVTREYEGLYEKLVKRMNEASSRPAQRTRASEYSKLEADLNRQGGKTEETISAGNSSNVDYSSLGATHRDISKPPLSQQHLVDSTNHTSHENINDLDDFASFLKSIEIQPPNAQYSASQAANTNNIDASTSEQFDNLLNLSNISDDTFKNLLLRPGNGNIPSSNNFNTRQNESSTNQNDPFSSWIDI